jgi:hypothetical protein
MKNVSTPAPVPGFFKARAVFLSLAAPAADELAGTFRQGVIGPGWYQRFALHMLGYAGLGDWRGKRFDAAGNGVNLVGPTSSPTLPMRIRLAPSGLDGKPAAVVSYGGDARFPWPHVVDELRVLDAQTWLGVSYATVPLVRHLTAAFLLIRQ